MSSSTAIEDRSQGVSVVANPKLPLQATAQDLKRLLTIIRHDVLPLTQQGVASGSKMFGAAILDATMEKVHANTNKETECPLFHGEVHTIYTWSQTFTDTKERREAAKSSIFLSTHEPCCMCISSILWSGFTTVYYFFPYEMTAAQGIPYDIQTMHELWGVNTYRKTNKYLSAGCIMNLIDNLEDGPEKVELQALQKELIEIYDGVSKAQDTTSTVM